MIRCKYDSKEFIDLLIHVSVAYTDIFKENEVSNSELFNTSHHKHLSLPSHKI